MFESGATGRGVASPINRPSDCRCDCAGKDRVFAAALAISQREVNQPRRRGDSASANTRQGAHDLDGPIDFAASTTLLHQQGARLRPLQHDALSRSLPVVTPVADEPGVEFFPRARQELREQLGASSVLKDGE